MGVQVVSTTTASTASVIRLRATVAVSDAVASTTYEIPITQIEYISLGTGVVLDTAGRFKLLSDATIVADTVEKSFAKGLTDAASAVAAQPALEAEKNLSDSFSLTDELTRTLVFLRNFTDTATATAAAPAFQFARGIEREFLLALDEEKIDFTKVITDGFAMNDSADVGDGSTYFFSKGISNITFATDASTRSVGKGLTDSATADDAPVFSTAKGLFDTASPAESQFFEMAKALADVVTTPDAPALSVSRPLTDGATAVDNSFLQFAATRVESAVVADEGFLFAQNYCDVTYFASDYVGVSQSF